jgi:hypothetical protein
MRTHGKSKRRTWRKLHLCVDRHSGEIETMLLSEAGLTDGEAAVLMLQEIDQPIEKYAADGAYDKRKVYERIREHSADCQINIPPRKDAHIWQHGNCKAPAHLEMKTCAIFVSMDALPGNETLSIINILWQKPPCFA